MLRTHPLYSNIIPLQSSSPTSSQSLCSRDLGQPELEAAWCDVVRFLSTFSVLWNDAFPVPRFLSPTRSSFVAPFLAYVFIPPPLFRILLTIIGACPHSSIPTVMFNSLLPILHLAKFLRTGAAPIFVILLHILSKVITDFDLNQDMATAPPVWKGLALFDFAHWNYWLPLFRGFAWALMFAIWFCSFAGMLWSENDNHGRYLENEWESPRNMCFRRSLLVSPRVVGAWELCWAMNEGCLDLTWGIAMLVLER